MDKNSNSQKKSMDNQDVLCYVGAFFFFVMALVPILLRNFDPNYDENKYAKKDQEVQKREKLTCSKVFTETGYSYVVEVNNLYEDEKVKNSIITYTIDVDLDSNLTIDQIEIPEYSALTSIKSKGISYNLTDNVYKININYKNDESLMKNAMLDEYYKEIKLQKNVYTGKGYICNVENLDEVSKWF